MPEQPKDLPTEQQRNGSDRQSAVSTTTSYLTQSVAIVGVIAITVVITLWLSRDSERSGVEILIPPPAPLTFQASGAVVRPSVYCLDDAPRIDDAVNAAGGFTDDANFDLHNRALRVRDGSKVVVPSADNAVETTGLAD
jgi:protein involved in polysaccharide export with SLBB domain